MFGVVKYLKPPSKTCGSDYSMFISIVDDSSTVKLKCMIFARNEQMLPPVEKLGEIVRFHRMKVKYSEMLIAKWAEYSESVSEWFVQLQH